MYKRKVITLNLSFIEGTFETGTGSFKKFINQLDSSSGLLMSKKDIKKMMIEIIKDLDTIEYPIYNGKIHLPEEYVDDFMSLYEGEQGYLVSPRDIKHLISMINKDRFLNDSIETEYDLLQNAFANIDYRKNRDLRNN